VDLVLPDGESAPIYFTAEDYTAEGNGFDCSIRDSFTITCPSAFMQQSAGLRWSKTDATWNEGSESVVAFTGARDWYRDDLLVAKEDWLRAFLAEHDLALILGSNGERRHLMGRETYAQRWLDYYSVAALTHDGSITGARQKVIDHTGGDEDG
jgi:hypothetical protein